ncbi:hypothetical protein WDW86_20000 [Bdellovibrionota bacterium FG-2]
MAIFLFIIIPKKRKFRRAQNAKKNNQARPVVRSLLGRRINVRFYLSANAALIFVTLSFGFVPCVGAIQKESERMDVVAAIVSLCCLGVFSGVGLLYAIRKGDLSWLRSYHRHEDEL